MDERLQIKQVLKGDTSAFTYFVDTYQDMAITIAFRICGNRQDAEDIVQNAYVKAFHNLHTFRADSKFSTWFYRVVYNTALTHISSSGFNIEFVDYQHMNTDNSFSEWDTLERINEKERTVIINETLEKMPKDESLLLTLYYLEENSIKDIVIITGLGESNIKVKLYRARKRFADIIGSMMHYERI